MKTNILYKTFLLCFAVVASTACDSLSKMAKNHDANAEYIQTPNPMELHGHQVKVNVSGTFKPNYFNKKAGMIFQPELTYPGGVLPLKPIFLKGDKVELPGGQNISYTNGGKFSYIETIEYKPEYDEAQLSVSPAVFPAKQAKSGVPATSKDALALKKALPLSMKILAQGVNTTPALVDHQNTYPSFGPDRYEKETIIPQKATLYFVVDMANLNLNFALNRSAESKRLVDELEKELAGNMEIKDIQILAWASPEGEESRNDKLSENRSKTGERFLNQIYDRAIKKKAKALKVKEKDLKKALPVTVKAMSEDWEGFLAALRASDIAEKNTIINVVTSQTDKSRREQEIRNMTVIYKQIEDQILPPLRRADILVNFKEIKKTEADIAAWAISKPDTLSLEELLYAATLTEDKATKIKIYNSATELHKEDWRGFNNAAYYHIELQDFDKAAPMLEKANAISPDNAVIINNLGVIALSKDDSKNAKAFFESAKQKGSKEAAMNLAPILISEGNYSAAIAALKEKKCSHNLALAQLLGGDLAAAKQTLQCAPETALSLYLKAVCEARAKGQAKIIIDYLKKAIALDAELKVKALKDVEFAAYKMELKAL